MTRWIVFAIGYWQANSATAWANSNPERSGVGNVKCRPAFGSTTQKTFAVPRRSYSLSRRASRPGLAGIGARTSACRVTGFSSKQTTGSAGSYGFSYVSSTSSILPMYSSSSSATHHIFFPPRLEVVGKKQDAYGFSAHAGNHPPLHGFLGHQTHGPAGAAFGRIATHHGDNPLLLAVVENGGRAGALLLKQRRFQTPPLISMPDRANSLSRQWDDLRNPRRTGPFGQLQQRQGTENNPNLLHSAAQQLNEFLLILRRDIDTQRWTAHAPSMRPRILHKNGFYKNFRR